MEIIRVSSSPSARIMSEASRRETNIVAPEGLTAIGQPPEAQRETALLVYSEGYSYAEASSAPQIPIDAVMNCLAAAQSTLAKRE